MTAPLQSKQPAPDVVQALKTSAVWSAYQELAPSHKNEYLKWIDEAKKADTRAKRIQKMCDMLTQTK